VEVVDITENKPKRKVSQLSTRHVLLRSQLGPPRQVQQREIQQHAIHQNKNQQRASRSMVNGHKAAVSRALYKYSKAEDRIDPKMNLTFLKMLE
jgi:hypothetical protein